MVKNQPRRTYKAKVKINLAKNMARLDSVK